MEREREMYRQTDRQTERTLYRLWSRLVPQAAKFSRNWVTKLMDVPATSGSLALAVDDRPLCRYPSLTSSPLGPLRAPRPSASRSHHNYPRKTSSSPPAEEVFKAPGTRGTQLPPASLACRLCSLRDKDNGGESWRGSAGSCCGSLTSCSLAVQAR